MRRFKYIGSDDFLVDETALGKWTASGTFRIQVDRFEHPYSHGWHRAIERHWEEIPSPFADEAPDDRPSTAPGCHYNGHCMEGPNCPQCSTVEIRTSRGGFVGHMFVDGKAACGYSPSSPRGYLIRDRAGWKSSKKMTAEQAAKSEFRWCPKCKAKFEKEFDIVVS